MSAPSWSAAANSTPSPSGEKHGSVASRSAGVSRRASGRPLVPPNREGSGAASSAAPLSFASFAARPVGSSQGSASTGGTSSTNTPWRLSSTYPSPFIWYLKPVIRRASSWAGSTPSSVLYRPGAGMRAVNARRRPSGDQTTCPTPSGASVSTRGSPPRASTTASWGRPLASRRRNASRVPSGLKEGAASPMPRVRRRGGSAPLVSTTHSWPV